MDNFTDIFAIFLAYVGKYLNAKQKRSSFVVWTVCLFYWIARDISLDLWAQAIGCVITIPIYVYGWIKWKKQSDTV